MPSTESDNQLSQSDLLQALTFAHNCQLCNCSEIFHQQILSFAELLGFKSVLYGYTLSSYSNRRHAQVINLSNPEEWAKEYSQNDYLLEDPVMHQMELCIAVGDNSGFIIWDAYDWPVTEGYQHVVDRRRAYGLNFGCSIFSNSPKKDFAFLISFADENTKPDKRTEALVRLVISELMVTKKRLIIQELIATLSEKERAVADAMMNGKTNWEISKCLDVTENSVKYYIKQIFNKLDVRNRQQAVGVLLAERYLSI